jgi:hypothetical protein
MARKERIAHIAGRAASGAPHGVLIERSGAEVSVTITGADGVKRHASSLVSGADIGALIDALTLARDGGR